MSEIQDIPAFWLEIADDLGLVDWCGDAYEFTPLGELQFRAWLKKRAA